MDDCNLLKTSLHGKHVAMDATMGGDDGWDMPLSYSSAIDEATLARQRAAAFDVSHVGRIRIRGNEALDLVERVCTADVVRQEDDTARFTLLCNEAGGIIDQCLCVRLDDFWVLTTSPANREKVLAHLQSQAGDFDVKVDDQTLKTTMICVAGPAGEEILDRALPIRIAGLAPGEIKTGSLLLARYIAIRSAYAGLWSLEVMLPNMFAAKAWRFITEKAGSDAIAPAGMAGRDMLRIEAGQCRYGHELNETIDPFTAGLGWAVDFSHDFVGSETLDKLRDKTPARKRVGLSITDGDEGQSPAIARQGDMVFDDSGREIGIVTSGTYSPLLQQSIAMAYVSSDEAKAGRRVLVEAGGERREADLADLPFRRP